MSRKTAKRSSGTSDGERSDARVDGTLRRPFDSLASAASSVARYLTSVQAASRWRASRGMPMTLPLMKPEPYRSGRAVVDRQRRRPVVELLGLDRDERDAPFAVEAHRQPAGLERVVGRELVADAARGRRRGSSARTSRRAPSASAAASPRPGRTRGSTGRRAASGHRTGDRTSPACSRRSRSSGRSRRPAASRPGCGTSARLASSVSSAIVRGGSVSAGRGRRARG